MRHSSPLTFRQREQRAKSNEKFKVQSSKFKISVSSTWMIRNKERSKPPLARWEFCLFSAHTKFSSTRPRKIKNLWVVPWRGTLFHDGRYKTGAPNGALHCSLLFALWRKDNHRRLLDGGYSLPSGIPRNLCYALISAYIAGALRRARNNRTFLTFNRIHNLFRFGKNHRFYTQCQCFRVHAFGRNIKIIGTNL